MIEERDVIVIGAGIAGLTAARELRDLDPLVLEASDRVGGRIWSQQRGDLAVSVGAHMFPPPASTVGRMVEEYGLEVLPITGSMLNVALRGRLVSDIRPELMPFKLPLSTRGRVSFARAGLKVKRIGDAYMKLAVPRPGESAADVRLRLLQYGGDRSFADFLGPLHPEAAEIYRALCNRTIAEPNEISEGSMAALFGHVWDSGDLGRAHQDGEFLFRQMFRRGPVEARGTVLDREHPVTGKPAAHRQVNAFQRLGREPLDGVPPQVCDRAEDGNRRVIDHDVSCRSAAPCASSGTQPPGTRCGRDAGTVEERRRKRSLGRGRGDRGRAGGRSLHAEARGDAVGPAAQPTHSRKKPA